jgi:thioredoxin 1
MTTAINSISDLDCEVSTNSKILVIFYAEWCRACVGIDEIIAHVSNSSDIHILTVDTDKSKELVQDNSITDLPCYIFFKNGVEINRMNGTLPKELILQQSRGM